MSMTELFQIIVEATLKGEIDWHKVICFSAPCPEGYGHLDHFDAVIGDFDLSFSVDVDPHEGDFTISFEVTDRYGERFGVTADEVITNDHHVEVSEEMLMAAYFAVRREWLSINQPDTFNIYYGDNGLSGSRLRERRFDFVDDWYNHG